jgi:AraC family transcriptional regulator of adaptative response / DNA-3-methyladenine glycosylase II
MAMRAIVGQQITVAAATKILARIATTYGERIEGGDPELNLLFPQPEVLAAVELSGMPGARARTLRELARCVSEGAACLETGASLETSIARLVALPGIGPWTANYIAMRALGEPDAFPAGDVALRRAAGEGALVSETDLLRRAERWRPWRAYAAILLWRSLSDSRKGS